MVGGEKRNHTHTYRHTLTSTAPSRSSSYAYTTLQGPLHLHGMHQMHIHPSIHNTTHKRSSAQTRKDTYTQTHTHTHTHTHLPREADEATQAKTKAVFMMYFSLSVCVCVCECRKKKKHADASNNLGWGSKCNLQERDIHTPPTHMQGRGAPFTNKHTHTHRHRHIHMKEIDSRRARGKQQVKEMDKNPTRMEHTKEMSREKQEGRSQGSSNCFTTPHVRGPATSAELLMKRMQVALLSRFALLLLFCRFFGFCMCVCVCVFTSMARSGLSGVV